MFSVLRSSLKAGVGWLANQILISRCFVYLHMLSNAGWSSGPIRSVSARLIERFIFNFRLSPNALAEKIPVSWLRPQVLNGWAISSFCILKIERLMLRPIPSVLGLETICCAYRCGVIDCSDHFVSPSVYIVGRNTDRSFVTLMAPMIFESAIPRIEAKIERLAGYTEITAKFPDGRPLFSAKVCPRKEKSELKSKAFASLQDFVEFIKDGISSYARSNAAEQYSRIDLCKEDTAYESMDAVVSFSQLDYDWKGAGLEYDSVARTGGGGLYKWTFKGKIPAHPQKDSGEELIA
jgi:hypothetical protein